MQCAIALAKCGRRLAIVGESKWQKGMASFCKPFTTAKIKFFDHAHIDAARQWVIEDI